MWGNRYFLKASLILSVFLIYFIFSNCCERHDSVAKLLPRSGENFIYGKDSSTRPINLSTLSKGQFGKSQKPDPLSVSFKAANYSQKQMEADEGCWVSKTFCPGAIRAFNDPYEFKRQSNLCFQNFTLRDCIQTLWSANYFLARIDFNICQELRAAANQRNEQQILLAAQACGRDKNMSGCMYVIGTQAKLIRTYVGCMGKTIPALEPESQFSREPEYQLTPFEESVFGLSRDIDKRLNQPWPTPSAGEKGHDDGVMNPLGEPYLKGWTNDYFPRMFEKSFDTRSRRK
ncbi:MAG: hypothetical protein AB7T38_16730 [Nitrospirales bacterium]